MIAMIGTLPHDADRMFSDAEEADFFRWGHHIQRADALADLVADLRQGLISTTPVHRLWHTDPRAYEESVIAGDAPEVYRLLASRDIDISCVPDRSELVGLTRSLADLGELPALLEWIRGFLTWRYLAAPFGARDPGDVAFGLPRESPNRWAKYVALVEGRRAPAVEIEGARCLAL
jgi:hypothetical protein